MPIVKKLKLSSAESSTPGGQAEGAEEEAAVLSDEDVTKLVGTADACKLEVSYTIYEEAAALNLLHGIEHADLDIFAAICFASDLCTTEHFLLNFSRNKIYYHVCIFRQC